MQLEYSCGMREIGDSKHENICYIIYLVSVKVCDFVFAAVLPQTRPATSRRRQTMSSSPQVKL